MNVVAADKDNKAISIIKRAIKIQMPGCGSVVTASEQQSIDIVRVSCTSLVVIGIRLRDMTGFGLVKQIRYC